MSDIEGAKVDVYGRIKKFMGRNNMNLSDIDKTSPNQYKGNVIVTNIPDYKTNSKDIDFPMKNKFKTMRNTDPLNPTYIM